MGRRLLVLYIALGVLFIIIVAAVALLVLQSC